MTARDPRRPGGMDPARSPEVADARHLMEELQLQKIELEMQSDELAQAQEALKLAWSQLEQRVAARTAALTQAMESLSQEVRVRTQAELSLLGAFTELEALRDRLLAENARLRQEAAQRGPGG